MENIIKYRAEHSDDCASHELMNDDIGFLSCNCGADKGNEYLDALDKKLQEIIPLLNYINLSGDVCYVNVNDLIQIALKFRELKDIKLEGENEEENKS